jgi:septal ring factor EnvC (AmiA/AmiB activator)|tara:strand:+ start:585 stop:824 length:240 start_codon:yes stop_codon:yes gene_type:complete
MTDNDKVEQGYSRLNVEIAVLKTKGDQTNAALKSIINQINEVEHRVRKLERTTYLLLGGLIFLQLLPMFVNIHSMVIGQ